MYPKSFQGFACPAVIHGHGAVGAPRDNVPVIGSQANDGITVETKAFHQRFSNFEQKKNKQIQARTQNIYFIHFAPNLK